MNTSNIPYLIALVFVVLATIFGSVKSPENIIQIAGFGGVITAALLGIIKQNASLKKQDETAEKVVAADQKIAEVAVTLEERSNQTEEHLRAIENTGEKTHTLVNSNMGVQLKMHATVTARLAAITKDPEDIKAAELAKSLLHEHEKKQLLVDQNEASVFPTPSPY